MQQRFALYGPVRFLIGLILMSVAVLMIVASDDLDWGIAATSIIPALVLSFIALALLKRKVLFLKDQQLEIEVGWLWRRCHQCSLQACQLELAPMAGLWAVIVHGAQRPVPLAAWISKDKAQQLMTFLDQAAPDGQWPRKTFERAQWDR